MAGAAGGMDGGSEAAAAAASLSGPSGAANRRTATEAAEAASAAAGGQDDVEDEDEWRYAAVGGKLEEVRVGLPNEELLRRLEVRTSLLHSCAGIGLFLACART